MGKKFVRRIEDFVCENCGRFVRGNGYTNHCPYCLWSKHVDIYPGDREESCHGMMEPIGVEIKKGEIRIIHKCKKCGKISINRKQENDNFELILELMKRPVFL